jgi:DNA-binding NtrC family response regulator
MTEKIASPSGMMRVLVAAYEEALLAEIRDTLRENGYAVAASPGGRKAVEMLKEQQFAAVLADVGLPDLSGVDVLHAARQEQPDATRVLIAANLTLSAATEAINRARVQRLVLKPLQREGLLQHVGEAVAQFQNRHQERLAMSTTRAMNETLTKLVQSMQREREQRMA